MTGPPLELLASDGKRGVAALVDWLLERELLAARPEREDACGLLREVAQTLACRDRPALIAAAVPLTREVWERACEPASWRAVEPLLDRLEAAGALDRSEHEELAERFALVDHLELAGGYPPFAPGRLMSLALTLSEHGLGAAAGCRCLDTEHSGGRLSAAVAGVGWAWEAQPAIRRRLLSALLPGWIAARVG